VADAAATVVAGLPPAAVRRLPPPVRGRVQLLMNRALKRRPRAFSAVPSVHGFTVDGHTADLIQRYLYVFGEWEPDITAWVRGHLRAGDVVVDIGANIGYVSLLAASLVGPTGAVIAFEPVPSIADLLEANARRNGLTIDVRRQVVSDTPGSVEIFKSAGTNIGRSGTAGGVGTVSEGVVPAVTATDAIDPELWPRIRLIKIDTEGDEQRALRGLGPVLDALAPGAAVLVEISPDDLAQRGGSAAEVLDSLRDKGFDAFSIRNSYAAADYARPVRETPVPLSGVPRTQTDVVFVKRSP
jgi:FkbM family methyltransferase